MNTNHQNENVIDNEAPSSPGFVAAARSERARRASELIYVRGEELAREHVFQ